MSRRAIACLVFVLAAMAVSCRFAGAEEPRIEYKFGHLYHPGHPFTRGAELLAAKVKEKTGGGFVINVYPAGQLGSEKDLCDSVVNNIIQFCIMASGEIGKRYKPILVIDSPFLFDDYAHAQKVLASDVVKELWAGLEKATRIRMMAPLYYGTRYVTSKKPITRPEDMKGMKLRSPDMPLSMANARAMGANPTPMALSEVYLALQQNVVDGQENPVPTTYTQKFYEVQSHLALTGHVLQLAPIFMSVRAYDKLPDSYKKALDEAMAEIKPIIDADVLKEEKAMLDDMKAKGMTVTEVDKEAFREATRVVIREFEGSWGPGLYEKIRAIK